MLTCSRWLADPSHLVTAMPAIVLEDGADTHRFLHLKNLVFYDLLMPRRRVVVVTSAIVRVVSVT